MTREEAIRSHIPYFDEMGPLKEEILQTVGLEHAVRGESIHRAGETCKGTIVIVTGLVRAYSDLAERKELTLYRLSSYDMCLFSASCTFRQPGVQISLEADEDTDYLVIPTPLFMKMQNAVPSFAKLVSDIMQERFADIFTLLGDILTKKLPTRLASLLLEEATRCTGDEIAITQDRLASHLGSAREVVTRTLKYLQDEGLITIGRGQIIIRNRAGLEKLASSKDAV